MKKIILFISICLLLTLSYGKLLATGPEVKDITWDEEKRTLSYNLSEDSVIKIRVGKESGPIYQTPVNLEERKRGLNQETWSGKDPEGKIDFVKLGSLHFCVDPASKEKDLKLLTNLSEDYSLEVDLEEDERIDFEKNGFEVRTFLDGNLIKVNNGRKLPYSFKLDTNSFSKGEHILSINIWPLPSRSKVAYDNIPVLYGVTEEIYSPKVAFSKYTDNFWQVCEACLDGSNTKVLTKSPVDKTSPAFSPDGKLLAYTTNTGQLWVIDRIKQEDRRIYLPINCAEACFAPDGKKIIFTSLQDLYHGDTELWTVTIEDGKLEKLISRPWLQYNSCFSPDGKSIIFVDGPELYGQEIRKLNLETKDITQLTDNGPYDYDAEPVFSVDGESIFYSSNESGNYDIWVMDKFGRNPLNLTKNPADDKMPRVSGDGKTIYFLSDRSNTLQVWRMDIDGLNPKQISKEKQPIQGLSIYEK